MPRGRKLLTLIAATAIGWASGAPSRGYYSAQQLLDMSLEELQQVRIRTVTKTETSQGLAPAVITVLTAHDLHNYGYESVAEALSHVAGFIDNPDLTLHNFGVRGVNAGARAGSRILKVMINGQPVAFRPNAQLFLDRELIPMALIERIEIVRGPASALYGANAFLAVVNIITRSAASFAGANQYLALSAEQIEAAESGRYVEYATGFILGPADGVIGIGAGRTDRGGIELPRRSPDYNRFSLHEVAHDRAQPASFYSQWQLPLAQGDTLALNLHWQRLDSDNVFADLNPLRPTGRSRVALDNGFARAQYTAVAADAVELRFALAYAAGGPTDHDRLDTGADSFYLRRALDYHSLDGNAEMQWTPSGDSTVLLGFDFTRDHYDIESFIRADRSTGAESTLNPPQEQISTNTGIYGQWQHELPWSGWHGIVGLRLDQNSQYDQQSSFRAGLVGQLPHQAVLKLLAGSAFQAPSPELLFRNPVQGNDIIGNPELAPQEARTLEANLVLPLGRAWQAGLTLFQTDVEDLVILETNYLNLFAKNSSDSRTRGLELDLHLRQAGWSGYANYLYQDTERDPNPFTLIPLQQRPEGELFPRHSGNLGLSYQWQNWPLQLSVDNRYVGRRPASTQNVLIAHRPYELADYVDTTMTLNATLWQHNQTTLNLRAQVRDLFDSRQVTPGFGGIDFPSLGRRYLVTLALQF